MNNITTEISDFETIKSIIKEREDSIVDEWAVNVQKEIKSYVRIEKEIIKENMKRNLECIIAYINDNIEPTDSLINEIAYNRANMNFKIVDITKAVLIGREIIHNHLFEYYKNYAYKHIRKIDNWFFYTIITHAETHAYYLEKKREKNGASRGDSYIKEYLEELKKLF